MLISVFQLQKDKTTKCLRTEIFLYQKTVETSLKIQPKRGISMKALLGISS